MRAKRILKAGVKSVVGDRIFTRLMAVRSRNQQLRWLDQQGILERVHKLTARQGTKVLHGPFKGLEYPPEALNRHACPLILGSYELELQGILSGRNWREYAHAVDIGGAEGYYAVGIARSFHATVYAFEADPRERVACRKMAELNNVSHRVNIADWADSRTLIDLCSGKRCLVLSDCEGYEIKLFDAGAVESLKNSDVIIEVHEPTPGTVRDVLMDRFRRTHSIEVIGIEPRRVEDFPEAEDIRDLVEYRDAWQTWLWCQPSGSAETNKSRPGI
jgi:hypothetical protein